MPEPPTAVAIAPPPPPAPPPLLAVPALIEARAGGRGALAIALGLSAAEDRDASLIISGLPRGAMLSSGTELIAGTWQIGLGGVKGLQLSLPATVPARSSIELELRDGKGRAIARSRAVLTAAP
jgi:hypothetical protein